MSNDSVQHAGKEYQEHSSTVIVLASLATLGVLIGALLPAFVGILIDYMGLTEEAAAVVAAKNLFGVVGGVWISMILVRKWQAKVIAFGGLLGLLSFELLTIFLSVDYLGGIRILAGLFGGIVLGIGVNSLAQVRDSDRGFAIFTSLQFLVGGVGFVSLPFVLPFTNGSAYSLAVAGLALIGLIITIKMPVFRASPVERTGNGNSPANFVGWFTVLSFGIFQCGAFSIWTYMDRIGLDTGLSMEQVGATLAGGSIAGALGAALAAYLGTKFGRLLSLVGGASLFVLGIVILTVGDGSSYVVGNVLIGIGWAFALSFFLAILAALDPDGDLATAGVSLALIGMAAGPALAAAFIQENSYVGSLLAGICVICVGVLAVVPGAMQLNRRSVS